MNRKCPVCWIIKVSLRTAKAYVDPFWIGKSNRSEVESLQQICSYQELSAKRKCTPFCWIIEQEKQMLICGYWTDWWLVDMLATEI